MAKDTEFYEVRGQLWQLEKIFCRTDDPRRLTQILKDYSTEEQACFKSWLERLNGIRDKPPKFKWDKTFVRQLLNSCSKDLRTLDDAVEEAEKQTAIDEQANDGTEEV